jgi:peptidoglycan/xylan/chitin deacetylase (PgdA/CDA1 family)
MDPDPEAEQAVSQILRTTFVTVVFTACNYYKTETCLPDRQATATVTQIPFSLPDSVSRSVKPPVLKKKKRTIYLTFDDGPNKGTPKMMEIVKEEQIPVTVFIVGQHVYGSRAQTATFDSLIACKYFEIANHGFTHAFENRFAKFYTVPDSALKDFIRCADSLHLTANIIRTPGRNIWRTATISSTDINKSKAAADSLYKDGLTEVGWDLEWHYDDNLNLKNSSDEILQQVDSMFANAKTKTPDHLVLLAHDQVYEDATDSCELHQFIKKLKAKDEYNFEIVSKYPGLKN